MSEIATERQPEGAAEGNAMKTGGLVFLALAVFTVIEYVIAKQVEPAIVPLFVIAAVKAGLILWYFMHMARSWRGGHS